MRKFRRRQHMGTDGRGSQRSSLGRKSRDGVRTLELLSVDLATDCEWAEPLSFHCIFEALLDNVIMLAKLRDV